MGVAGSATVVAADKKTGGGHAFAQSCFSKWGKGAENHASVLLWWEKEIVRYQIGISWETSLLLKLTGFDRYSITKKYGKQDMPYQRKLPGFPR